MKMRYGFLLSMLALVCSGCIQSEVPIELTPPSATTEMTEINLSAAFTQLDHVDVFDLEGRWLITIDSSGEFPEWLPAGEYYMDFVNTNGDHSFTDDERIAFAPMGEGMTPIEGPIKVNSASASLWKVAVDPVLEANARLTERLLARDETLKPFLAKIDPFLTVWGPDETLPPTPYAFSPSTGATSARLRVTWELSFAMTGKFTTSSSDGVTCNTSPNCWPSTRLADNGNGYHAYWDYDNNGTGYIDYDPSALATARSAYSANGITGYYFSCVDGGYCGSGTGKPTVSSANAKNYTCQSSSGVCTGGSSASATKPRGGQCKAFANLVLYRSGQYRSSTGGWKSTPTQKITFCDQNGKYPFVTSNSIAVGDLLQRVQGQNGICSDPNFTLTRVHTMIVVAYDSAAQSAMVVDSNFIAGGNGYEYIGMHYASFNGSEYSDLDNYRDMDCVYSGNC